MPEYRKLYIAKALLIILIILTGLSANAQLFEAQDASPTAPANPFLVDIKLSPEKLEQGQQGNISVIFTVPPKYYLYADQVKVDAKPVKGLSFGKLDKPVGTKKNDPYLGVIYMYSDTVKVNLPVIADQTAAVGPISIPLTIEYQGCSQSMCFTPVEKTETVSLDIIPANTAVSSLTEAKSVVPDKVAPQMQPDNPFQKAANKFGILGVLIAAFIWGFVASLTPCVYPMIPVTVSVIGASGTKSVAKGFFLSLSYVLGLSLTYAIFGIMAAWSGELFGSFANHPATRIVVAVVFVLLALSMFEMFNIQMPSSVSSRLSNVKGSGPVGVFLIGMASGAVVGPCVGPLIVGLMIYIATLGSKVMGFLIMWFFALGFGILFLLIGTFTGFASALPKSGMWMVKLKQFFGMVMLSIALYFIAPLIDEKIFFLIVGIFLTGIGVFIGALDTMTKESSSTDRFLKTIGIVLLVLGIGYLARFSLGNIISTTETKPDAGIMWLETEQEAIANAKTKHMPVMIDFYADWCTVCKKLEHETFASKEVISESKKFVCVRIDCTNTKDPMIKEITTKYKVIGLPTIVFIDANGKLLSNKTVTEFISPKALIQHMKQLDEIG